MCRTAEKFPLCARRSCTASNEDYSSISCTWQMRRKKRERMNFNPSATPNAHVTRVPSERAHIQYMSIHHGLRQTICHLARVGEWGWEVLFMPNLASRVASPSPSELGPYMYERCSFPPNPGQVTVCRVVFPLFPTARNNAQKATHLPFSFSAVRPHTRRHTP